MGQTLHFRLHQRHSQFGLGFISRSDPVISEHSNKSHLGNESINATNLTFGAPLGLQAQQQVQALVNKRKTFRAYPADLLSRVKTSYETLFSYGQTESHLKYSDHLVRIQTQALANIDVPIIQNQKSKALIRTILRAAFAWYLNYIVHQFNNFAARITDVVFLLGARLGALESHLGNQTENCPSFLLLKTPAPSIELLVKTVSSKLSATNGRVLVVDRSSTEAIRALSHVFANTYGLMDTTAFVKTEPDLEVRHDNLSRHLSRVAYNSLEAVVILDELRPSNTFELSKLLSRIRLLLQDGAILVLLVNSHESPISYGINEGENEQSKLTLSVATWERILTKFGFTDFDQVHANDKSSHLISARIPKAQRQAH